MAITCLTEKELLKISKKKDLSQIKELNLSDYGTTEIDCDLFNKLTRLEELDLSDNSLTEIPRDLTLPKLTSLDVSKNDVTSVDFVAQFPKLSSLYCAGNKQIKPSDVLIAATLCPSLEMSDMTRSHSLQTSVGLMKEKLTYKIKGVWQALFEENVHDTDLKGEALDQLLDNFISALEKQDFQDDRSFEKFHKFLVKHIAKELINAVASGRLNNQPSQVMSTRKRPLNTIYEEDSDWETPQKISKTPNLQSVKPKKNVSFKKTVAHSDDRIFTKALLPKSSFKLPQLSDYDPVEFIRCHCFENDPNDNNTKVWKCAFEPDPNELGANTAVVATCGGKIVCLIDCETRKLMKRYKDANEEESFYCLAWTSITTQTEDNNFHSNILAVAGEGECIKLLHPQQLLAYSILKGHKKAIQSLLFHPNNPTQLFSGSDDGIIFLWDIGIPNPVTFSSKHSRLLCIQTPSTGVLNLIFSPKLNWLLAGCEDGCFGWKLQNHRKDIRFPSLQFSLPQNEDGSCCVDGLALLPNDIIASKCVGQPLVYLWKLEDNIQKALKSPFVSVDIICGLRYPLVTTPYINISHVQGILITSDEEGRLLMYDMSQLSRRQSLPQGLAGPSRVLDWPDFIFKRPENEFQVSHENVLINSATLSADKRFLVAATDNNLVCIWQKN